MTSTYVLYHYNPSFAAALCFTVAFGVSTAAHLWQACRYKTRFMIPFIIGAIIETLGYAARIVSAKQSPDWSVGPYAIQSLLLLLAPPLLAASIYMVLGRIIRLVEGEERSLLHPKKLTKVFTSGDVLSFLTQCAGGGMLSQAKTESKVLLGERVIIVGLFVQVLFFGGFMILSVLFHRNIHRNPTTASLATDNRGGVPAWKTCLYVLYTVSLLIMVRSIYRVVEYIQGSEGYLQGHEAYLYVLDAALMLVVCGVFIWKHPGALIRVSKK
ncbi:RTA1 like protein [Aspergillus cavernicola]|uniref:RTA1 like protein n=1 Tax=Aspergillus cavernicola TaxID=176166 RepID=A0ABR4HWB3_9EURO